MEQQRMRSSAARRKKMRARRRRKKAIMVAIVVVLAFILIGIIQYSLHSYVNKYDSKVILDNVLIGDVEVSGMTAEQASSALDEQVKTYSAEMLTLKVTKGVTKDITYGDLGLYLKNKDAAVKEAVAYGKSGSNLSRYKAIKNSQKKQKVVTAEYAVKADTSSTVLTDNCAELYHGPVNATLVRSNSTFSVSDGKSGTSLDVEASIKKIDQYLNNDWHGKAGTVQLESREEKPEVTAEALSSITDLLGSFTTTCEEDGSGRVQNVAAGAAHINGTLIQPGEEFSANAAMEPYTQENGYTEAGSYENGTVVETMGGGICQVSSTLYNAVLYAELEVTQRQPHSMMVNYVDPSRDAAIADDVKDLKFKNNLEHPVYLEAVQVNGELTFNIYGIESREAGRTVDFESETLDTTETDGVRYVATDDSIGSLYATTSAHSGITAQLWKVVYQNGEEVSRDVINDSQYEATPLTYGVGTYSSSDEASDVVISAISSQNESTIEAAISRAESMLSDSGGSGNESEEDNSEEEQ
ncbi:MAG: VanW family protein [Hespellia sp.]|nr:VanW family protein [Hespellia sp.]